ncbi:2-haloacid dehalogenase [Pseudorhizobium tarimense]|uniref:(S)-2-haloacid dehalogenase n=1 Tax=Pseudorhizobium tarimense TaxID=1079109 RepID=A0ABV2H792_9HYPH|nr:haloacid dehalogenase type II [Pseudorhizobium tarimense]MCJ8519730.1 haloacid dehalogenase type II [Pseudorhizobium tarimense]
MCNIQVLFFDVLGSMVDWRGSITTAVAEFFERYNIDHIEPEVFADAWVGRYDASVDDIRVGKRSFASLDQVNRENLDASLAEFGLASQPFSPNELQGLNLSWHRLKAWPDVAEGLSRLKSRFIIAPLSDGHTRLLVNVSKHNKLPWDAILGADIFRAYKPMPRVYLRACELLEVKPQNAMLVASHDYDLEAARRCGLRTAYIVRSNAADPSRAGSRGPQAGWDYKAKDLIDLAEMLNLAGRFQ